MQRAKTVLGMIWAEIRNGTDHQALTHLNDVWPDLTDKERTAVKRHLQKRGFRGAPLHDAQGMGLRVGDATKVGRARGALLPGRREWKLSIKDLSFGH